MAHEWADNKHMKKLIFLKNNKTTTSDDNIPIETSTSSDTVNEDEPEEANAFKIPDWAKSPELRLHIQRQEGLDPDKIFGRVPPFQIRGMCSLICNENDAFTYLPNHVQRYFLPASDTLGEYLNMLRNEERLWHTYSVNIVKIKIKISTFFLCLFN